MTVHKPETRLGVQARMRAYKRVGRRQYAGQVSMAKLHASAESDNATACGK